jgi:hypothetical protein
MSGKGDKWRKTDFKKFFNNFEKIKFNHKKKDKKNEKKKSGNSPS